MDLKLATHNGVTTTTTAHWNWTTRTSYNSEIARHKMLQEIRARIGQAKHYLRWHARMTLREGLYVS